MKELQDLINEKADRQTKEFLNNLLIQCLEIKDGTRTGEYMEISIGHGEQIKANTSDVFRGLFAALEPFAIEKARDKATKEFLQDFYSLQGQFDNLLK